MVSDEIAASRTIADLFVRRCAESADEVAYEHEVNGEWKPVTWGEYGDLVKWVALGFESLGVPAGSKLSIWADTTPEWTILDLAIMARGGCAAGIYQTCTTDQATYIINDSGSVMVAADTPERLEMALATRYNTPSVRGYITWYGDADPDNDIYSLADLIERGKAYEQEHPGAYREAVDAVTPDTTAVLVYTSGTTGPPKGAMLSHTNCLFCCREVQRRLGMDIQMSSVAFLPLSHVAERVVGFFNRLYAGGTAYFMPDLTRFADTAKEKSPTVLGAVPRLYEKIYAAIMEKTEAASPTKRALFQWALKVGSEAAQYRIESKPLPPSKAAAYGLADKLVLSKVRGALGGRVQYMVCGAAPIAKEIIDFWNAVGIPFYEVYGMTESSGISHMNYQGAYKSGTVGTVLEGYECKLAEDGEILVRGEGVFQGYINKPEATAETIDDEGWLHTGDIGEVDDEGFLQITDRKKNLIVTAGGKNVAPSNIELLVTREPIISQVVVIGDRRRFLSALITLSTEELQNLQQTDGFAGKSLQEIIDSDTIQERVRVAVDRANQELARYENIRKYRILPAEFSIESGEMTPTMKLKRKVIEDRYADTIESFYGEETELAGSAGD